MLVAASLLLVTGGARAPDTFTRSGFGTAAEIDRNARSLLDTSRQRDDSYSMLQLRPQCFRSTAGAVNDTLGTCAPPLGALYAADSCSTDSVQKFCVRTCADGRIGW